MCESQRLLLASTLRFPMYGNTAPAPEGVGLELLKHRQCFGGHSERETPGHIPNPEAKTLSADGTAGVTLWESRTPPDSLRERLPVRPGAGGEAASSGPPRGCRSAGP